MYSDYLKKKKTNNDPNVKILNKIGMRNDLTVISAI